MKLWLVRNLINYSVHQFRSFHFTSYFLVWRRNDTMVEINVHLLLLFFLSSHHSIHTEEILWKLVSNVATGVVSKHTWGIRGMHYWIPETEIKYHETWAGISKWYFKRSLPRIIPSSVLCCVRTCECAPTSSALPLRSKAELEWYWTSSAAG